MIAGSMHSTMTAARAYHVSYHPFLYPVYINVVFHPSPNISQVIPFYYVLAHLRLHNRITGRHLRCTYSLILVT